ncbi:hypothetical protein QTP70_030302 [Hemibagrus guttatus]|uniref:Fibrinogen C-terminal domain-containing protein n=1 Tax=Hemibagrus guttatus TaxID=175788 RepID=A0AAE0UMT4_9TELE|nr:hypothetical protein QTP70_030302 [Hemibagrus guttatus]
MKLQLSLLCLCAVVLSALCEDEVLGPRGPRPVELGFKADRCATEKEWPFCVDDEWGRKCPSGCRIQGLLDQTNHDILKKIEKIRRLLDEGKKLHRSTDLESKNTYSYLRDRLVSSTGNDNRYASLAEQLRQRIVDLKIKIDRQLRLLDEVKGQIKTQFLSIQRLEVDIDIKLRSCKGSCASYVAYSLDKDSYDSLEKQLDRLDTLKVQSVETVSSLKKALHRRKTSSLTLASFNSPWRLRAPQQKRLPPVSKVSTGTAQTTPISTSQTSTLTLSCTQTVRKITTHTKDGVKERYETVRTGPGCDSIGKLDISEAELLSSAKDGKDFTVKVSGGGSKSITSLSRGDADLAGFDGDFFQGLGSNGHDRKGTTSFSSSSSSSSTSKSILTGGSKGFHSDTKTIVAPSSDSFDLGKFLDGEIDDDVPDLHARSLKSRDDRKADFIGGDCVDIQQKHTAGGQSGLFRVKPAGSEEIVEVYCDQATGLGGWVLIQQREDGSVNFNRTWDEYKVGFGKIDKQGKGEIWIGNNVLHLLSQKESVLRVELFDWAGNEVHAEYYVQVGSEAEGFQLNVSSYTGDAGDALVQGLANMGSFLSHAGMKFSTFDRDNDKWEENCAEIYGGGWWYNNCQSANLNGIYYKSGKYDPASKVPYEVENGVVWLPFKPADYSLKMVRMKDTRCPSGCRLQGFIDQADRDSYEHLNGICEKTKQYKTASSSTIMRTAQVYEEQRKIIIRTHMEELRYAEAAEMLNRNLTLLQKKITEIFRRMQTYHIQTEEQIDKIQQLEADIDIKLRACKGSCKQTFDHVPDHQTLKQMQDDMAMFHMTSTKPNTFTLDKKLKLQPVARPHASLTYRKLPFVYLKLLEVEDTEQNQVVLDKLLQDVWNSDGESDT